MSDGDNYETSSGERNLPRGNNKKHFLGGSSFTLSAGTFLRCVNAGCRCLSFSPSWKVCGRGGRREGRREPGRFVHDESWWKFMGRVLGLRENFHFSLARAPNLYTRDICTLTKVSRPRNYAKCPASVAAARLC